MGWILPIGFIGTISAQAGVTGFSYYSQKVNTLFTQEFPDLAALAAISTKDAENLSPSDKAERILAINSLQAFAHAFTSAQIADDFSSSNFSRFVGDTLEKITHNEPTNFNIKDENRDLWNNDYGINYGTNAEFIHGYF